MIQLFTDQLFKGHPGVLFDDICISGKIDSEHLNKVKNVLQILEKNGFTINYADKCVFFEETHS